MVLRAFMIGTVWLVALAGGASAGGPGVPSRMGRPTGAPPTLIDWQDPAALPPQFRNHCSTGGWFGRPYCADHCGREYQLYYCSGDSFGCCKVGYGYCDYRGHLRCHP
jgi:hypothetical protein